MIIFEPSTEQDLEQIQDWTDRDKHHRGQNNARWWLTGNGLLSFALYDGKGAVFYVRMDGGEYARLSVQFAPEEIVSKIRLTKAMLQTFPKLVDIARENGSKGMIFYSESPTLIGFMGKLGFKDQGDGNFKLTFGE
jgi:hypothetical protein